MANIVIFDPGDTVVPGRVTQYLKSVNTPDYSGNVLINPDLSAVAGVAQKYWKESSDNVVEMSQAEKDALDDSVTIGVKNFKVDDYGTNRLLEKTTWYNTDEGGGVYSGKVEETSYVYDKNKVTNHTVKTFYLDGTEISSETWDYYTDDNNNVILKRAGV